MNCLSAKKIEKDNSKCNFSVPFCTMADMVKAHYTQKRKAYYWRDVPESEYEQEGSN